eukprot:m.24092 g.24092  ORF g.24092 m.24092 type:complete len:104 (+) comp11471_c0_seq4:22-333(+)
MFPWFKASKPVASQPSLAQVQTSGDLEQDDVDSVQQDFDGLPEAKPSRSKPRVIASEFPAPLCFRLPVPVAAVLGLFRGGDNTMAGRKTKAVSKCRQPSQEGS